jgi:hypothetical protein
MIVLADEWITDRTVEALKIELGMFEQDDKRKYYDQARYLIYHIPVYRPIPPFKIWLSDLTDRMKDEFKGLNKKTLKFVLKQSVGRIFEDIDASYYHTSISRLLEIVLV